ncbi:hypothetical protein BaRGS_00025616 [Batillaria attramentaria]|uniref:Uncharacterized protein n=1 Tax=Batillaria attramentaria TaxID=370345 RepID=A0ABD0K7V6_9CAEN
MRKIKCPICRALSVQLSRRASCLNPTTVISSAVLRLAALGARNGNIGLVHGTCRPLNLGRVTIGTHRRERQPGEAAGQSPRAPFKKGQADSPEPAAINPPSICCLSTCPYHVFCLYLSLHGRHASLKLAPQSGSVVDLKRGGKRVCEWMLRENGGTFLFSQAHSGGRTLRSGQLARELHVTPARAPVIYCRRSLMGSRGMRFAGRSGLSGPSWVLRFRIT